MSETGRRPHRLRLYAAVTGHDITSSEQYSRICTKVLVF